MQAAGLVCKPMDERGGPSGRRLEIQLGWEYLILALITAVAAFLRFYRLGDWSFWGDEVFSLGNKVDGFFRSTSVSLIHATTAALGTNEWTARLGPAIIGTFSIPLLYFPTRRVLGPGTALISAGLLAVSTWHIYWSQNARFYALLLLLYTFALLVFYLAFEEDRPWFIILSLILLGLAAKERLLALFFLPVVLVYLVLLRLLPFEKPRGLNLKNVALFLTPCILLGAFFAIPFLRDLPEWLRGFSRVNNNPFWLMSGTFYYMGLPTVILAGFGSIYFLLKKNRAALLLAIAAILPVVSIMLISFFQYTANRYVFVCLTSWIMLAALATNEFFKSSRGNARILASGVLAILMLGSFSETALYYGFQHGNRDNWKAAFEVVNNQRQPDDLIVSANPAVAEYYLGETVIGFQRLKDRELPGSERVWFVEDLNTREMYPEEYAWMVQNARQVANFDNHVQARNYVMRVYLYEPVH